MPATLSRLGSALTLYSLVAGAQGVSPEAAAIDKDLANVAADRDQSVSLSRPSARLLSQLTELVALTTAEHRPSELAIREAEFLLRSLTPGLSEPEITIEDDAAIALEWLSSRTRMLSVSVNGSGRLAYAWLNGSESGHAVARFVGNYLPPVLREIAWEVAGADAAFRPE